MKKVVAWQASPPRPTGAAIGRSDRADDVPSPERKGRRRGPHRTTVAFQATSLWRTPRSLPRNRPVRLAYIRWMAPFETNPPHTTVHAGPYPAVRQRLPSSRTSLSMSIIWYTVTRKLPVSYRGLSPHNNHVRAGRTHGLQRSRACAILRSGESTVPAR